MDLVGWVSFAIKTKYLVPNAWYSVKQILLGNDCRFFFFAVTSIQDRQLCLLKKLRIMLGLS